MAIWTVAGVQMDCRLGDVAGNVAAIRTKLAAAAGLGAQLVVFPECATTGYGFSDRAAATRAAETLPGPTSDLIAADCARLGVWAVYGLLEADGDRLFNSCAILGPNGYFATFRKIHLPCVGADRFTDPGDRPFAVHDLGGLKIGVHICFDGSFPESARVMTLLDADLLLLPTNWAEKALRMATLVPRTRAFENHVYHLAVNRIGDEAGYHYIGRSSACDFLGDYQAFADHDRDEIITMAVDPAAARAKKVVHCVGEYEIDRVNWRRPEMYQPLAAPTPTPFTGHQNR